MEKKYQTGITRNTYQWVEMKICDTYVSDVWLAAEKYTQAGAYIRKLTTYATRKNTWTQWNIIIWLNTLNYKIQLNLHYFTNLLKLSA